jgi:hypothetical protein
VKIVETSLVASDAAKYENPVKLEPAGLPGMLFMVAQLAGTVKAPVPEYIVPV